MASSDSFVPDRPAGRDVLEARRLADALASLITSPHVLPPLSIGLFGKPGAGKTFLLRMLRERVDRRSGGEGDAPEAVETIQVAHNAWHHAESNPWLAIGESVFGAVREWREEGERNETDAPPGPDPFAGIGTARRLRGELESKREEAERIEARAGSAFDAASGELEATIREHARVVSRPRWSDVEARFRPAAEEAGAAERIDEEGRILGFERLSADPEQLHEVLQQAKTLGGRAGLLTSSLKARRFAGELVLALIVVLLTALLALVLILVFQRAENTASAFDLAKTVLGVVSSLAGFAALGIAAVQRARAARALASLEHHAPLLSTAMRDVDRERVFEKSVTEEGVSAAKAALEDARRDHARAVRDLEAARHAYDAFHADGSLLRIVEAYRAGPVPTTAGRWADPIPQIREDLMGLSAVLARRSAEGPARPARIVVYVDDLDRCPPAAVVATLQAVGLLLAFESFVVVLASDPRWLERALAPSYRPLPDEGGGTGWDRSPLEGLIQAPVWLLPPTRSSAGRLLETLLPGEAPGEAPGSPSDVATAATDTSDVRPGSPEPGDGGALPREAWSLLHDIAGVVGDSPRTLKRLVNVCRLVGHLARPEDLGATDGACAGWSAVVAVAALAVATPRLGALVLDLADRPTQAAESPPGLDGLERAFLEAVGERGAVEDAGAEIEIVREVLRRYGARCGEGPEALAALARWRRPVLRHSFLGLEPEAG